MPQQEFTKVSLDMTTYDKLTVLASRHKATRARYLRELINREMAPRPPIINLKDELPKTILGKEVLTMGHSMAGTSLMPAKRLDALKEYVPHLELFDMTEALMEVKAELQKEIAGYEAKEKRSLIPFFKGLA